MEENNNLYKKITLGDILKPDFQKYGFKNAEEYNKTKKNIETKFQELEKKKRKVKIFIIIIQIIILANSYSNGLLLFLLFLNCFLFTMFELYFIPDENITKIRERNLLEQEQKEYNEIIKMEQRGRFKLPDGFYERKEIQAFIFDEETWTDLAIVIGVHENNFNHNIVLKIIDELLTPNIIKNRTKDKSSADYFFLLEVLAFLNGYNVISAKEQDERDIYLKELKKRPMNTNK